ncbi:MAG: redoxin family protein [Alphaproteobacteria bacterium]|nr:redoxin family protein [Alphaproteobacteria bacterium]
MVPLVLFLILAMLIASGVLNGKRARPSPLIGLRLPDIALPHAEDPKHMLLSRAWEGKPVLINVFASWCEPCRAEHPLLGGLPQQTGLPLYGIAWRDTFAAAQTYLAQLGTPYREVGVDVLGEDTVLLGLSGVPETLLLDKEGIVRWKYDGPLTEEVISQELLPLAQRYALPAAGK